MPRSGDHELVARNGIAWGRDPGGDQDRSAVTTCAECRRRSTYGARRTRHAPRISATAFAQVAPIDPLEARDLLVLGGDQARPIEPGLGTVEPEPPASSNSSRNRLA